MHTWVITSELSAKRIRERYLQAVLRQDPTFFDTVGAGEIVTRIQTDTREFPIYIERFMNRFLTHSLRSRPAGHLGEGRTVGLLRRGLYLGVRARLRTLVAPGPRPLHHAPVHESRWRAPRQVHGPIHRVRLRPLSTHMIISPAHPQIIVKARRRGPSPPS